MKNANGPRISQPQIDLRETDEVVCEICGNNKFKSILLLRRISEIDSPNGEAGLIQLPTYACSKCDHINKELDPMFTGEI